ncbi:MAG: Ger(x)C family spore germination protein [Acidibacillus sp.]|nr:Ger(x)C family spore germination protein [Acidibacillus sp.]
MAYKKWVGFVTTFLVGSILLTGCYDRAELEEQAFLVTMGIDKQKKGNDLVVTGRVAVPSKLSGSSSGGGGGGGDFLSTTPVVSATGKSIHEAFDVMNAGVERTINLSHLSAIMFGERAARQGILPYMRALVRYREFRRTLYLYVVKGSLGELFLHDKPVLETSATRVIEDLQESSQRTGFAPSIQVHELMNALEMPNVDPVLPVLSENEQVAKESKKTSGSTDDLRENSATTEPGHLNRAGGNPIECVGTAVFRNDRMVLILDGEHSRYMQLLSGRLHRALVVVDSPIGVKSAVSLMLHDAQPEKVSLSLSGKKKTLDITQVFEGTLIGDQTNASYVNPAARHLLEQKIAADLSRQELALIKEMYTRYDVDPFEFFRYARGQFPTFDAMENYDWHKQLPKIVTRLHVKVIVRRLGTQLDPPE